MDEFEGHAEGAQEVKSEIMSGEYESSARDLSQLTFASLSPLQGEFGDAPLWVSNNPEDVEGYGVLTSTRQINAYEPRSFEHDAPLPDLKWTEAGRAESAAQGCAEGTFKDLNLYLAHILSQRHLHGGRRLSVVIEADGALTLTYGGQLGTTGWSDLLGYKTIRADWLGAQVATDALNRSTFLGTSNSPIRGSVPLSQGERYILKTVQADSLIEGGFSLSSDTSCFAVHVIAHDEQLDPNAPLPGFAMGDVKWPGWYQGGGYGRAAGLYQGSTWRGEVSASLSTSKEAFGWRLFDHTQSPKALARHGDSADILFGGYGVVYNPRITLSNESDQCLSAHVGFTSYVQLAPRDGMKSLGDTRAPSVRDLEYSEPSKRPSMIWNGPIQVSQELRDGSIIDNRHSVILSPELTREDRQNPDQVASGLHHSLFRWDILPGEHRASSIEIPVPGYIVAPAALTVEVTPCSSPVK
jgi:hypothetical protein